MSNNGPKHTKIPMNPEEVKKLLATGDYDMPVNPIEQRFQALEQQVRDLLEQQKNLLEYIKELALTITETRVDKSD